MTIPILIAHCDKRWRQDNYLMQRILYSISLQVYQVTRSRLPKDLPAAPGLQEGSFFSSSSLRSSHSSPESSPSRTRRVAVMTSPPENPENPLPAVAGALETWESQRPEDTFAFEDLFLTTGPVGILNAGLFLASFRNGADDCELLTCHKIKQRIIYTYLKDKIGTL